MLMVMLIMKLMLDMKRMLLRPVEMVVKVFKESVSGLRPSCHPGREPPSLPFLRRGLMIIIRKFLGNFARFER